MIHPSYVDLMKVVNKGVEEGETPVINSRYSIVMATARRARQLVDGDESLVEERRGSKPLSIAVEELNQGKIRILTKEEFEELEARKAEAEVGFEEETGEEEFFDEGEAATMELAEEEPAADDAEAYEAPSDEEI